MEHWLIEFIGNISGLSAAQLKQIEKSLPATKALVDLLNRARPIIEQAQNRYPEAEPLIDQAKKEWQTVGEQILIDVISDRAALNGSINSVAEDHLTDQRMSCATVFGGTGFVGCRVVRHLRETGTRESGSATNSAELNLWCDNDPLTAWRPEARWELRYRLVHVFSAMSLHARRSPLRNSSPGIREHNPELSGRHADVGSRPFMTLAV